MSNLVEKTCTAPAMTHHLNQANHPVQTMKPALLSRQGKQKNNSSVATAVQPQKPQQKGGKIGCMLIEKQCMKIPRKEFT